MSADALRNVYWNTVVRLFYVGMRRVHPNGLVNLIGSALDPVDEVGVWLVENAMHYLEKQPPGGNQFENKYTTDATLIRDQIYSANATALSTAQDITRSVPAKLTGNKWVSTNVGATIYAT